MPDPVGSGDRRVRLRHRLRQKSSLRTTRIAAISAAATLVVLAVILGGWWAYSEWRIGWIELTNRGPVATVRVLGERSDEPIVEPFEVVKNSTLALPDGDYRLRIDAEGRLGRTYRVAVNRGETIKHGIWLDDGRLLGQDSQRFGQGGKDLQYGEPMPFASKTVALELTPGRSDLVEFNGRTLIRRDGTTGKVVWDALSPTGPYHPGREPSRWIRPISRREWPFTILEPAVDLDGDGTRDVLLIFTAGPSFLAISGADGSMIWNHIAAADGPGGPQAEGPELPGPLQPASRPADLIGDPAVADIDGDGTPDIVATLIFREFPAEVERRTGQPVRSGTRSFLHRYVQAISGRSGRWIWSCKLDPVSYLGSNPPLWWEQAAAVVTGRRSTWIGILDGTQYRTIDPASGKPSAAPIELGSRPVRPLQHADLDGDGEPELLALGPGPTAKQQSLRAFSIATGRSLWSATVDASYSWRGFSASPKPWPWMFDLDRDGRFEVIVPDSGTLPPKVAFRGMTVLDGRSGKPRWTRPMMHENGVDDDELRHLVEAPDLDGDGTRDLIAFSRFEGRNPPATPGAFRWEPARAYADALSARDGRLLWTWHVDLEENKYAFLWEPRWWGRGADGWPALVLPLGGRDPNRSAQPADDDGLHPAAVNVLEVTTGRELHRAAGLSRAKVADLDGDGLLDLWGEAEGQVRAYRGEPPECWSALGDYFAVRDHGGGWSSDFAPVVDLDRDGIGDVVGSTSDDTSGRATAMARSGRDGRLIWKTTLDAPWFWTSGKWKRFYPISLLAPPHGDLDGDGTPDVILQRYYGDESAVGREPASIPLQALSGRDGRPLWKAAPLRLGFEAYGDTKIIRFEARVFAPGELPDLLVFHRNPFLKPNPTVNPVNRHGPSQPRLARISGRTGQVVWDWPLGDQSAHLFNSLLGAPGIADLDGDGRLDVAVMLFPRPRYQTPEFELRAISLRDGTTTWSRPLNFKGSFYDENPSWELIQGTSSRPATVFVTEQPASSAGNELLVHALDGRDGSVRWTWRSGYQNGDAGLHGVVDAINLDGQARDSVCVTQADRTGRTRIVLLDSTGHELVHRDLPPDPEHFGYGWLVPDSMADLDGDGRDEVMVWHDRRLSAWTRDLKDIWSRPATIADVGYLLPAQAGRPLTMLVEPLIGVERFTAKALWTCPADGARGVVQVDPGDSARLPRVTFWQHDATVCRQVLPTTPAGVILPPAGAHVPADLVPDDPRWTRPLPWVAPVRRVVSPGWICALLGLALVNVVLPFGTLWLLARRQRWSIRLLMLLPVAVAVPLWVFQTVEPMLPAQVANRPISPRRLFVLATFAGLPPILFAGSVTINLVLRRWRALARLLLLSIIAAAIVAGAWIRADLRLMSALERYDPSGWPSVLLPGAFAAGALIPFGWLLRKVGRWPRPTEAAR
ncbi:MAG: FG-GAP repeat domain-containing protein [Isosphaeraceae bacterium]